LIAGVIPGEADSFRRLNAIPGERFHAVPPAAAPPEALVGRKVAVIAEAVYGTPALLRKLGRRPDLSAADWVGPDEAMAYRPLERWMAAQGHDAACGLRVDTMLGMAAAVAEGAGLAVLPCYLADRDERLRRVGKPIPELATDLWLLTHPDLRRVARIRAFMDFAAEAARAQGARFRGARFRGEA
jgi:DNA-binding transcriptional LysR family regulator